mmetsp:Transcript_12072/g.18416  ORF Transcript_12072/g.18416 Transcript_12072/m.18416 type:complete len:83 (+) Transcript_12072:258-506(+)
MLQFDPVPLHRIFSKDVAFAVLVYPFLEHPLSLYISSLPHGATEDWTLLPQKVLSPAEFLRQSKAFPRKPTLVSSNGTKQNL